MHSYQLVTTFRERLSDLCEKSPMNDSEIAAALGVPKQTLSAWKCGNRSPKRPTIEYIAHYFKVPVDWLMGFDVPETAEEFEKEKPVPEDELNEDLINLLHECSDLTPDELAQLRGYAACLKANRAASASHSK